MTMRYPMQTLWDDLAAPIRRRVAIKTLRSIRRDTSPVPTEIEDPPASMALAVDAVVSRVSDRFLPPGCFWVPIDDATRYDMAVGRVTSISTRVGP